MAGFLITLSKSSIRDLVEKEVSKVAAMSYSDSGDSLYDGIKIYTSDQTTIDGFMDDAWTMLRVRLRDIIDWGESGGTDYEMHLIVPTFDDTEDSSFANWLYRYFQLSVCAQWFQSRLPSRVEEYATRAAAALDKVVAIIKTIKHPDFVS